MGSSAQNSSGVHWCRRRVKFNEVPEKIPEKVAGGFDAEPGRFKRVPEKVPEKVWEALVQSQVRFNRVPDREALAQSQVRFNRVPEKVSEKAQSQVRFNRICGHLIHGCWGYHRSLFPGLEATCHNLTWVLYAETAIQMCLRKTRQILNGYAYIL